MFLRSQKMTLNLQLIPDMKQTLIVRTYLYILFSFEKLRV